MREGREEVKVRGKGERPKGEGGEGVRGEDGVGSRELIPLVSITSARAKMFRAVSFDLKEKIVM